MPEPIRHTGEKTQLGVYLAASGHQSFNPYTFWWKRNRYDAEMQAQPRGDEVLRARHYQSLMDALRLRKGEEVVGDPFVDGINAMIDAYVSDPEWMERYMTFEDELEAASINAEARGRRDGAMQAYARMVADGILDAERGRLRGRARRRHQARGGRSSRVGEITHSFPERVCQ